MQACLPEMLIICCHLTLLWVIQKQADELAVTFEAPLKEATRAVKACLVTMADRGQALQVRLTLPSSLPRACLLLCQAFWQALAD